MAFALAALAILSILALVAHSHRSKWRKRQQRMDAALRLHILAEEARGKAPWSRK